MLSTQNLELRTERLHLIPLEARQLQQYLDRHEQLEQELGLVLSVEAIADPVPRAIGLKLSKMAETDERLHPWYTYWLIVIEAECFGAGMIGFKGAPDQDGEVEIGYGIDSACRRRGFTTEAARALIAWAFEDPACHTITAKGVLGTNLSSQRVLEKVGMQVYAESEDTQDWRIDKEKALPNS